MDDNLKLGDCVYNKESPDVKYTLSEMDIDIINAKCVDRDGKIHTIPIINLAKCKDFDTPIDPGDD